LKIASVVDAMNMALRTVAGAAFKTLAKISPLANKISVFAAATIQNIKTCIT
jgi:hypothetical protein